MIAKLVPLFLSALLLNTSAEKALTSPKGGILGEKAPAITADQWVSLPKGAKAPTPESLKGKVIYLYCFQSWCPGCHKSGFPTLQKVSDEFKLDPAVKFLAIQTVFEGFSSNTPERAQEIAQKYQLTHLPIGQSGSPQKRSQIMENFKTRGTPWTIIIGRDGIVKYNSFHISSQQAISLIKELK